MFANCTHVIVYLLKAWKVTVVWIECHNAVLFSSIFINLWQTLSISFLLEMVITKDHKLSLSAILYVLSFYLTVAYHSNLMF